METKKVELSAQELAEFEAYKAEKAQKEKKEKAKENRDAYKAMVDAEINAAMPELLSLSNDIKAVKSKVYENFKSILEMKEDIMKVRADQRSHTFTNSEGNKRIMLGVHTTDAYRDTVAEGVAIVQEYITSLAKDDNSRALVNAVMRLLAKDQKGTLKASRVLQLRKMADDSKNERFIEGVRIIEESYQPAISKTYIKAEVKNDKGTWISIPLGMTEA